MNYKDVVRKIVNHPHDHKRGVDFIGVSCVFYCHDGKGKYLLHKRSQKARDEVGTWEAGAGAVEFGETFEQSVQREILEEYCCKPKKLKLVTVSNMIRENKGIKTHWVAVIFTAMLDPKKTKIGDPQKMDALGWFSADNLPSPLHSKYLEFLGPVRKINGF